MSDFDPLHVFDDLDDAGVYVDVHKCETCGVVGTMFYRSRHEPCPRCGETLAPTKYVAMWVSMTKVHRVPFKWWHPSTWFRRQQLIGAWVPNYRRMLEDGYAEVAKLGDTDSDAMSRLEYLGEHIFNFTTYDSEVSELFASKALGVCAAISGGTTFDYIKDPEQYRWFLLMCNMPFFADKFSWGTSIRGAWWDQPAHSRIRYSSCGLWMDGDQMADEISFTREQWVEFIAAVLAFADNSPIPAPPEIEQ